MFHNICQRAFSSIKKDFYVTTPIFYVNAAPHIGHLYSAVLSDAISRYEILKNPKCEMQFSTGTDEHGMKIEQAALSHKIPTIKYCNNISEKYKAIFNEANINYTDFIRTTESRHKKCVENFWNTLKSKNLIYSDQYAGWYCMSDESFLTETQTKVNPDGSRVSLESGHVCEWNEESNYMFPLNKFQNDIIYWIKSGNKIKPQKFEKILLDSLVEPLPNLSISRPSSRVPWGIKVPGDENQTIYVWLDALVNYLTCSKYYESNSINHWPPSVQVIGKDILKFHGIYWPAFLIAADIEPPQKLFVHSHWTVDGQKMSKSKFNVVDPLERSQIYTMEGLRYFLLREGVAHSDGNYSDVKVMRILNSELADTLGNLLSRACALSLNPQQIYPKLNEQNYLDLLKLDHTKKLIESIVTLPKKCLDHYDSYNFYLVVDQIIATLHTANNFFENCKPWEYKSKTDNNKLETILALTMDTLRTCGILLQPIIPEISKKLLDKLIVPSKDRSWDDLIHKDLKNLENYLIARNEKWGDSEKKLNSSKDAVLFRRILIKSNDSTKSGKNKVKSSKGKKENLKL